MRTDVANMLPRNHYFFVINVIINFRKELMFQQDNAPSHAAKKTMCWLDANGFPEANRMTWPAQIRC